jgi:hypothetical protein
MGESPSYATGLMNNLDLLFSCAGLRHPFRRTQHETYRQLNQQVNEVKRMLNSFIQKLTANS